jgi:hypothetical protein
MRKSVATIALLTVVLWLGVGAAQTPKPAAQTDVKLRPRGRQIVLSVDGQSHLLEVSAQLEAAKLAEATPLSFTRRRDFNYLLADVCGPSKAKSDMHECGAGTECDLLWVKLTPAWRVAEARAALYESCWQSATSDDGYQIDKNILRVEYDNFLFKHHEKVSYDAEQPERGLVVEESALPEH